VENCAASHLLAAEMPQTRAVSAGSCPLGGDRASQLVWQCHKACGIWKNRVFAAQIRQPSICAGGHFLSLCADRLVVMTRAAGLARLLFPRAAPRADGIHNPGVDAVGVHVRCFPGNDRRRSDASRAPTPSSRDSRPWGRSSSTHRRTGQSRRILSTSRHRP